MDRDLLVLHPRLAAAERFASTEVEEAFFFRFAPPVCLFTVDQPICAARFEE